MTESSSLHTLQVRSFTNYVSLELSGLRRSKDIERDDFE